MAVFEIGWIRLGETGSLRAMELSAVDLVLRSAAFALAMAAAAVILVRAPRDAAARTAAIVVGGIGAFVAASAPGIYAALGLAAFAFEAWCLATPAFAWLLAMHLFRDGPPPDRRLLLAPAALVIFTMPGDYGRFGLGLLGAHPALSQGLLLAGRACALVFLLAACGLAITHWSADLVERRRRLRVAFVAVTASVFLATAGSELVFGMRGAPLVVLLAAHSALVALALGALLLASVGSFGELLPETARRGRITLCVVPSDAPEAQLARRVVEAMEGQALWKRERLGIADLAAALDAQEYRLRRAINHHLGYRNFNQFLHEYRLRAAAARLADPAQDALPVLTIALDCGYGSIGPFNRAFKARYGITPTQYRNLEREAAAGAAATSRAGPLT